MEFELIKKQVETMCNVKALLEDYIETISNLTGTPKIEIEKRLTAKAHLFFDEFRKEVSK